jgi:hypothetical protein
MYILWPFGIYHDHLVIKVAIWYVFPHFGTSCQEKSGNPDQNRLAVKNVAATTFSCQAPFCEKKKRVSDRRIAPVEKN